MSRTTPPPDWGDPDPEEILAERAPEIPRGRSLADSARRLVILGLVLAVFAAIGGYTLARSSPRIAATLLVREYVAQEPVGTSTDGPAPTSGDEVGATVTCGDRDQPISTDEQREAMYQGVVVVHVRDPELLDEARRWAAGQTGLVITTPNEAVDAAVVATAWARRMRLDGVNKELLSAFVTAHGQAAPKVADC